MSNSRNKHSGGFRAWLAQVVDWIKTHPSVQVLTYMVTSGTIVATVVMYLDGKVFDAESKVQKGEYVSKVKELESAHTLKVRELESAHALKLKDLDSQYEVKERELKDRIKSLIMRVGD